MPAATSLPPCPRLTLGHARIHVTDFEQTVERILQLARASAPAMVVTPNADHLVLLETHAGLQAVYADADLVVPDGMPVIWASRLLRHRLKERVTGADLMPRLCAAAAEHQLRVYILGGMPGVADMAARRLIATNPGLQIAGTYSPPFGFEHDPAENDGIVAAIRKSGADLIFVGVGAPKQELWIHRHLGRFDKGVFLAVGAALDFCAGSARRAPRWMRASGLEWFYRWQQDPGRLTSRYVRDLYVLVLIAREVYRQRWVHRAP
ncbi:MAG: hypothetical protein JWP22_3679 [Ramlibacter sp.]|jgi:N-acetylglucosaminyldiphosphoundecaprenol N-acetyl-beta-D-mannosaminyltransferase|nr:hypothetical protein [Ramlibacter sp.]MDB5915004.1 hypothetical protein [Ramlibacter sp.]